MAKFQLGGGLSGLKFQKAPFWRIWTKIYCLRSTVHKPACASQIVSHILRRWRLTRKHPGEVESGFLTRTRSKIENELNRNKVQFDENKVQFVRKRKFHSM